jgi:hypothetical protein
MWHGHIWYIGRYSSGTGAWGSVVVKASREVSGSIPSGVTGEFFRG